MKKNILGVLLITCWFYVSSKPIVSKVECTEKSSELLELMKPAGKENEKTFLNNLAGLCGKSFRGKETYTAPGRDSWANKDFVMHVTVCEEDKVYIPFHLGEDHSRTWMFIMEGQKLRFRHDHRHEDGTPEELTMYGGYSDGTGTGFIQKFPADDYTLKLLDDNASREWRVILAEDLSTFTYQLLYNGKVVFSAEFDLNRPI